MASTTGLDLSVAGLASGLDWKTLVSQLADVSRAPERTLQTEQSKIQKRNAAYKSINTELSTLQDKIKALQDTTLYGQRTATSSDSTIATATAAIGTPTGSYEIQIGQLAKAAVQRGTTTITAPLSDSEDVSGVTLATAGFGTQMKGGTFTINGKQVTVDLTKSLADVFNDINTATDGAVTASYDPAADKISLQSADKIVLGSATDTSNFLQVTKLTDNSSNTITSSGSIGGIRRTAALSDAHFANQVFDDGTGNGQLMINGVTINYNASSDSVTDVLNRINNSEAGVSASFDSSKGQFLLTSKATGDMGISLQDISGNFLQAAGLLDGTLERGQNLLYSINGGGQLVSQSNTITEATSGIAGLSVTALKANSTVSISIGSDTSGLNTAINDFITQYNKVQTLVDTYTASSTDATGKVTAGILASETDAADIANSLRRISYNPSATHSSKIASLDDLGIATNGNDNKLVLSDSEKLSDALANNLNAVQDLFTNTTSGIATALGNYMDRTIGDEGSLIKKQNTLTKQSSDIDTQIASLERRVQSESDNLTQQFISMETAQQNLSTQLKYLQQNLGLSTSSSSSK